MLEVEKAYTKAIHTNLSQCDLLTFCDSIVSATKIQHRLLYGILVAHQTKHSSKKCIFCSTPIGYTSEKDRGRLVCTLLKTIIYGKIMWKNKITCGHQC